MIRVLRLATIATLLLSGFASAQILDHGYGECRFCGHSDLDTTRYAAFALNEILSPTMGDNPALDSAARAYASVALYLLTASFDIYGVKSPDSNHDHVIVSITLEIKNGIPTGKWVVTTTTESGETKTENYLVPAAGIKYTSIPYAPGAKKEGPPGRNRPSSWPIIIGGEMPYVEYGEPEVFEIEPPRCGVVTVDDDKGRITCQQ